PAGPDHAQIASAQGIIDYFDAVYEHHFKAGASPAERNNALNQLFHQHEEQLMEPLLKFLNSRSDIRLVGPGRATSRAPIISILPLKKDINEVYQALIGHKIMLGIGDFYAVRPLMDMEIPGDPGVIRMSFMHYTSPEEIDQLIDGLKKAL
ncbi:aminotransferase class V-fold PLP-dependent enzyme, partial [Robiginitalea sp.]|uniref:aminotransferase class V-fold PLP-dependent enzyme n=1 Tax=Robiginitalea sp. TaxID=1902411 RepID=UPI003C3724FD